MIVGGKKPGFYMYDVLKARYKQIRWVGRDSLGQKKYDPVDAVRVMTVGGSEVQLTLVGDVLRFMTMHGSLLVRPVASNVVEITVGEAADF